MVKKRSTRSLTLILAIMLIMASLFSVTTAFAAATGESFDGLYADASAAEGETDLVKWQNIGGKYYLFLPSCVDLSALELSFGGTGVKLDGKDISSGETTDVFADKGEHTLAVGSNTYSVIAMQSANIPAVFVTTDSGNMDYVNSKKGNEESGYTVIVDAEGNVEYDNLLDEIKGRGNSTWGCPKKPYNLKLEKKTDLFGLGKSKKWSLLANYYDQSLIRNSIMYNLAAEVGVLSHDCTLVDVYFNGAYNGTYLLTEKVDIEETKVDIDNMQDRTEDANPDIDIEECALAGNRGTSAGARKYVDIPNDPEDITGGFILEFDFQDRYAEEVSGFVTNRGQCVVVKEPEYATKAQVDYIADYFQDFEDALYSDTGYNSKGKHFSEYCDIDSLARQYLLQELALNIDAAVTSFFFYKDSDLSEDGMMYCDPTWDFDSAIGNYSDPGGGRYGYDTTDASIWFVRNGKIWQNRSYASYLAQAYTHEDVYNSIIRIWNEDYIPNLEILMSEDKDEASENGRLKSIAGYAEEVNASAEMNFIVWDILGDRLRSGAPITGDTIEENIDYVKDFFNVRVPLMDADFGRDADIPLSSIAIKSATDELGILESTKLTLDIDPTDATNTEVEWSSSDENIAIVDEDGVVTGYKAGEVTVTAAATDGSGVKAEKKITVKAILNNWVTVNNTDNAIKYGAGSTPGSGGNGYINNDETLIKEYAEFTFEGIGIQVITALHIDLGTAEIFIDDESMGIYDWYDPQFLKQQVVYENTDLEPGEHTIKIVPTGKANPASIGTLLPLDAFKYAPVSEEIVIEPVKIRIDGETTVDITETTQLTAVRIPDVSAEREIIWSSSDETVAKVDDKGVVTGVGAGTAEITAKVKDNEEVCDTVEITVPAALVTGVAVSGKAEMTVGDEQKLTADVSPEYATDPTVEWASSDDTVATVDDEGNVKAVSAGNVRITASSADGGAEGYIDITVKEAEKPEDEEPKDEDPKDEDPKDEEPKDEDPKDEEPKDEDPKDEEPKDEEPKDEEPKDEDSKEESSGTKTGDASHIMLWVFSAIAAAGAIVLLISYYRLREE